MSVKQRKVTFDPEHRPSSHASPPLLPLSHYPAVVTERDIKDVCDTYDSKSILKNPPIDDRPYASLCNYLIDIPPPSTDSLLSFDIIQEETVFKPKNPFGNLKSRNVILPVFEMDSNSSECSDDDSLQETEVIVENRNIEDIVNEDDLFFTNTIHISKPKTFEASLLLEQSNKKIDTEINLNFASHLKNNNSLWLQEDDKNIQLTSLNEENLPPKVFVDISEVEPVVEIITREEGILTFSVDEQKCQIKGTETVLEDTPLNNSLVSEKLVEIFQKESSDDAVIPDDQLSYPVDDTKLPTKDSEIRHYEKDLLPDDIDLNVIDVVDEERCFVSYIPLKESIRIPDEEILPSVENLNVKHTNIANESERSQSNKICDKSNNIYDKDLVSDSNIDEYAILEEQLIGTQNNELSAIGSDSLISDISLDTINKFHDYIDTNSIEKLDNFDIISKNTNETLSENDTVSNSLFNTREQIIVSSNTDTLISNEQLVIKSIALTSETAKPEDNLISNSVLCTPVEPPNTLPTNTLPARVITELRFNTIESIDRLSNSEISRPTPPGESTPSVEQIILVAENKTANITAVSPVETNPTDSTEPPSTRHRKRSGRKGHRKHSHGSRLAANQTQQQITDSNTSNGNNLLLDATNTSNQRTSDAQSRFKRYLGKMSAKAMTENQNLNCAGEPETLEPHMRDSIKESQVLIWIYNMIDEAARVDFEFFLKDGCILCKLMNRIVPDCIPEDQITWEGARSKQKNIVNFLREAEKYGVSKAKLFFSEDLLHLRHVPRVTRCIYALAKIAQSDPALGSNMPQLGDEPSFLKETKIVIPGHRDTKDVMAQLTASKEESKGKMAKKSLYK